MSVEFTVESVDIENNIIILKYKVEETDTDFSYLSYPITIVNNDIDPNWKIDAALQIQQIREYRESEKNRILNYKNLNIDKKINGKIRVTKKQLDDRIKEIQTKRQQEVSATVSETVPNNIPGAGFIEEVQI